MKSSDYRDFAKVLRGTIRRADTFGHSREDVLEAILAIAEANEATAERIEMDEIVAKQVGKYGGPAKVYESDLVKAYYEK